MNKRVHTAHADMKTECVFSATKVIALIAVTIIVVTLSWLKPIDEYTNEYIDESIVGAGIIFGISRGINAAISAAQSVQVGVGFASGAPGEFLDPINDLIERFSEVIMFSITSLALQKILLEVTAHWVFSSLVTISAVVFAATLALRQYQIAALRAFVVLVIVRMFLSVVILVNSAVDQVFLDSRIANGTENMNQFRAEVTALTFDSDEQKELGLADGSTELIITDIGSRVQALEKDKAQQLNKLEGLEADIIELEGDEPFWKPESWFNVALTREEKESVDQLESEKSEREVRISEIEETIARLEEERECAQKQIHGEACTFMGAIYQYVDGIKAKLPKTPNEIQEALGEKAEELIMLMSLILLKAIFLPLVFWFLMFKVIKSAWIKIPKLSSA